MILGLKLNLLKKENIFKVENFEIKKLLGFYNCLNLN